jgi:hypothetical protein
VQDVLGSVTLVSREKNHAIPLHGFNPVLAAKIEECLFARSKTSSDCSDRLISGQLIFPPDRHACQTTPRVNQSQEHVSFVDSEEGLQTLEYIRSNEFIQEPLVFYFLCKNLPTGVKAAKGEKGWRWE